MSTAALCGDLATVGGVDEAFDWEVNLTQDAINVTSYDSAGWGENIACLKGATGSFKSYQSPTSVGPTSGQFKTASAGGFTISGSIIITKITCDTPVEGAVTFSSDFVFTGAVSAS